MPLRILFVGIPAFALKVWDAGHTLAAVVLPWLEEDAASWELITRCGVQGVPVLPAEAVTEDASPKDQALLRGLAPVDLVLVMNFDRRLEPWAIQLGQRGAWNVHPSLLPRLRGYNPYFWAIIQDQKVTGVSVHHLTANFDEGDILDQVTVPIPPHSTGGLLHDLLHTASMPLVLPLLERLALGQTLPARPQDHALATRAPKPREADLSVDVNRPADECVRRIRAATPYPGARLVLSGRAFTVTGATLGPDPPPQARAGQVFLSKGQAFVAAGAGSFRPLRLVVAQDPVALMDLVERGA
jgi:methionyl-tRNA formyltransferase